MNGRSEEEREMILLACQDMECCMPSIGGEDLERFEITYTKLQNPTDPTIRRMVRRLDLIYSLANQLEKEMYDFMIDGNDFLGINHD